MLNRALVAGAITFAAASAQADDVLLSEGFNSVATLSSGWVLNNLSSPVGSTGGWFQGEAGQFTSQSGADEAYIAANYNNAEPGGTINNWLITPTFSTENGVSIPFWAKAVISDPFFDQLAYGISGSGSSDTASFAMGSAVTVAGDWTKYTFNYAAQGAGSVARFAINYTGAADLSNYVGVDTLTVTAVPEPTTWMMMGLGLMALTVAGRRSVAKR